MSFQKNQHQRADGPIGPLFHDTPLMEIRGTDDENDEWRTEAQIMTLGFAMIIDGLVALLSFGNVATSFFEHLKGRLEDKERKGDADA